MTMTDDLGPMFEECPACNGLGYFEVEDCEDGITDTCGECNGEGLIVVDYDKFVPKRDAFKPGD